MTNEQAKVIEALKAEYSGCETYMRVRIYEAIDRAIAIAPDYSAVGKDSLPTEGSRVGTEDEVERVRDAILIKMKHSFGADEWTVEGYARAAIAAMSPIPAQGADEVRERAEQIAFDVTFGNFAKRKADAKTIAEALSRANILAGPVVVDEMAMVGLSIAIMQQPAADVQILVDCNLGKGRIQIAKVWAREDQTP